MIEASPTIPRPSPLVTLNGMGRTTDELNEISCAFVDFCGQSTGPVLDIGAAFGIATIPALATGAEVIANDLDPRHLEEIHAKAEHLDFAKLRLCVGKFPNDLSFEECSLGAIHVSNVLHFLPGPVLVQGIALMYRWLVPGGKVFSISGTPYAGNLRDFVPIYELRKANGIAWPGELTYPSNYSDHPTIKELPAFLHLLDEDILVGLFASVGFKIELAQMFLRRNLPSYLSFDGRENIAVIASKPLSLKSTYAANTPLRNPESSSATVTCAESDIVATTNDEVPEHVLSRIFRHMSLCGFTTDYSADVRREPTTEHDVTILMARKDWRSVPEATALLERIRNDSYVASVSNKKQKLAITLSHAAVTRLGTALEAGDKLALNLPTLLLNKRFIVDFCDPNATKALHVGHLRNIALGHSTASLLAMAGAEVLRQSVICDIGRNVCEAMAGYMTYFSEQTPISTGLKPDVLVGKGYAQYVSSQPGTTDVEDPNSPIQRELEYRNDLAQDLLRSRETIIWPNWDCIV